MDLQPQTQSEQETTKMHEELVKEWTAKLKGRRYVKDAKESVVDRPDRFTKDMLPPGARVLEGPTAIMTMDYRVGRLNVHVDEHGKFDFATAG